MTANNPLTVHSENGTRSSPKLGMQVWIRPYPKIQKAFHHAKGTITGCTATRVTVMLDPENAVCRTHRVSGFKVVPDALTTVNPFV